MVKQARGRINDATDFDFAQEKAREQSTKTVDALVKLNSAKRWAWLCVARAFLERGAWMFGKIGASPLEVADLAEKARKEGERS